MPELTARHSGATVCGRGSISFSLIENLTGAATARDTFILAGGAVAGSIDDRAGVLEVQVGDFLVLGGDGWAATLGVNWYLNSFTRFQFNVVHWNTDNRAGAFVGPDDGQTVMTRIAVTF